MLSAFAASIVAIIFYFVGIIILAFLAGMIAFITGCIRLGRIESEMERKRSRDHEIVHGHDPEDAD